MHERPELPQDYRCPFCPSHVDDEFVWHELAEAYVCRGCQAEIDCGFDFDQQPTADDYNCADTIARVLQHLQIDYATARKRHGKLLRHISSEQAYIVIRI